MTPAGNRDRAPTALADGAVLTAAELRSLDGLAGQARDAAFLRLWTRKEAVLKAAGVGLGSSRVSSRSAARQSRLRS